MLPAPQSALSAKKERSQVRAGLDPQRFTIVTAPALLAKGKPWRDYCDAQTSLKAAIRKLVGRK
jgi:bifunctional non-homologous end joining protein LigD